MVEKQPALALWIVLSDTFYRSKSIILLSVASYVLYRIIRCCISTYRFRRKYNEIPHLPRHPLWGNIQTAAASLDPSLPRSYEYGLEEIWDQLERPAAFLIDLAPLTESFLVVVDPDVAEQISSSSPDYKYSPPKSANLKPYAPTLGWQSLVLINGEQWRTLRRRFNPGFQPHYIHSFVPVVASQTRIFVERLAASARAGETIAVRDYAQDLISDIILQLTTGRNLHAQSTSEGHGEKSFSGFLGVAQRLAQVVKKPGSQLHPLSFLNFVRPTQERFYEFLFYRKIRKWVLDDYMSMQLPESSATQDLKAATGFPSRSITQLAMSGLPLGEELINSTVDQVKTFFFAGRDTTVTTIQWMAYYLSKASRSPHYAKILQRLHAEHDEVFGAESAFTGLTTLSDADASAESTLSARLPYTTAFVKETLRLHPPAASSRDMPTSPPYIISIPISYPDGSVGTIRQDVSGLTVSTSHYLLHRNPAVWGPDARVFRPDRWLDEKYMSQIRSGSWRPFEHGPRNCIGQELAMMELKIVLIAIARGFEFEKIGYAGASKGGDTMVEQGSLVNGMPEVLGFSVNRDPKQKIRHAERIGLDIKQRDKEVWACYSFATRPLDGMRMRVRHVEKLEHMEVQ